MPAVNVITCVLYLQVCGGYDEESGSSGVLAIAQTLLGCYDSSGKQCGAALD